MNEATLPPPAPGTLAREAKSPWQFKNPNVASQYGIRSIPTLMVFKGGQKVDTVVGAVPKATLSGTISKHL